MLIVACGVVHLNLSGLSDPFKNVTKPWTPNVEKYS